MRKIFILVLLVGLSFAAYYFVVEGVSYENFKTITLNDLEVKSSQLSTDIATVESQNSTQYTMKKTSLESAVKDYKNQKKQYEELLPAMQAAAEESSFTTVDLYDIDFLWTIIGNYATEESIVLKFDVTKSASSMNTMGKVTGISEYMFCDLNFAVSGDYISITDFIYDLEDDDRLNFEISNFKLEKGGQNLQATFVVKNVPINEKNLSKLTSSATEDKTTSSTTSSTTTTVPNTSSSTTTGNLLNKNTIKE